MIKELTGGRGADMVIECAGVPQAVPEALEMLRVGGLLVEAGNFSDLGEVPISPHRHLCAKNVRILGVGGEEPAAYGPEHEADGALHEALPIAGIRYPPVWSARRGSRDAEIGAS
jgi:threonine dehydrogenase-like Zn-dependent dehydrogenase